MNQFLTLLLNGLSLGCIYALIAIGFVVVFKATRVLNFAHGSILLLGAYVVGRTHESLGFWLAALCGIAAAAIAAALVELVIMRRVRGADLGTLAILTLGVDILMLTELSRRIGTDVLTTGAPWGSDVVEVAGLRIPESRVIAAGVAVVLVAGFAAAFKFSDWGIAMRSAAEDGETASLMGIRLSRVALTAWALAGALAAIAGLFLASFPSPGIDAQVGLVALAAIPAWVLGGFDSIPGAIVGGLIIGVLQELSDNRISPDWTDAVIFGYLILIMTIRPRGLLGEQTREAG